MTDASMFALACWRGRSHDFDWYSGWCRNGCGNRDDGRVVNRAGEVLHKGPDYTTAQLDRFRERLERLKR